MPDPTPADRIHAAMLDALRREGCTLDDEAADALHGWVVRTLETSTSEDAVRLNIELMVSALARLGRPGRPVPLQDFRGVAVTLASIKHSMSPRSTRTGARPPPEDGPGSGDRVTGAAADGGRGPGRGGTRGAERGARAQAAAPPAARAPEPPLEMAAPPRAGEPAATAPPPADEAPRSAYALLDAPDAVVAEAEFEVRAGLQARQSPGVFGDALVLPESTGYPYVLSLQLVAEGFEPADDGGWRREVTATAEAPYPSTVFRLRAAAQAEAVLPRALRVLYSVDGQTIGSAFRPVVVARTAAALGDAAPPLPAAPAVDIGVPAERVAPDLTVHVLRDEENRHRLLWTLESPHPGVVPHDDGDRPMSCDIGDQPREFARQLVQQVNLQEGKPSLRLHMRGLGRRIAANVPEGVWRAFHAAAAAVGGPPSVLLLCDEAYIPWELALVPDPLPDPEAPPFLGAQANVGRWVFGQPTPPLPPPHEVEVRSMAVVWGVYDSSRWARLEAAEQEAAALGELYGAVKVDARIDTVLACLEGTPPANALHFAIHGLYNPGGVQDGLVLVDDQTISPVLVSGADLPGRPLVFLNACQVGSSQEVLGDFAGMAGAFLEARASAVVAPLWSVKDTIAREISLDFYEDAFDGEPVAAVLRRQRARYGEDDSATYLAYQFFGHPALRLRRTSPRT